MKRYFDLILDALFPKKVTVEKLEMEARNGELRRLPEAPEIDEQWMHAVFHYKDKTARQLIWEIKYTGNRTLVNEAGKILWEEILSFFEERDAFAHGKWGLVPVPASKIHAKEKGFNQTEELCRSIVKNSGNTIEYLPNILIKTRETLPQAKVRERRKRLENLKGTFAVKNPDLVKGKNIIVIDDVITTGSTFVEARRALKEAGAKRVLALALAH